MPHAGRMVLLEEVDRWDAGGIVCRTRSHCDPVNPLRASGRLAAVCGIEYALQAAALHGALMQGGARQDAGYAASLRGVTLNVYRLDDQTLGALTVEARLQARERFGMVYDFALRSEAGATLLEGRASIALPR